MSKGDPLPSPKPASQSLPVHRIGDLVWCQEAKNHKLWWPAMVTYDPHAGIFFRTTKCSQYHVQYFGITAIRGWVSVKSCVPLKTGQEKPFIRKGLSKKIKGEYEVAMQEVVEAAKLDYKQRKLKFIFSFRPSRKGEKQSKQESKEIGSSVELKVKTENTEGEPTSKVAVENKTQVKLSGSVPESRSDVDSLPDTEEDSNLPQRSSDRVKKRKLSVSKANCKSKVDTTSSQQVVVDTTDATVTRDDDSACITPGPSNGQWDGAGNIAAEVCSPSLHSMHSSKSSSSRRRRSESNPMECGQCLEYVTGSEGVELKCTNKPEIFVDPSIETSVQPILMYVQKQYGNSKTPAPFKASVQPNLNLKPHTKGMSTINLSTNVLSSSATKQSHTLASRVKGSERGGKAGSVSSRRSSSPSSPMLSAVHGSSNGNISSESGYETGKNLQPVVLLASRKRRRRINSSSCSVSSLAVSPLVSTQTKVEEEASVSRKRKHGKSSSLSSLQANNGVEAVGGEEDCTASMEAAASPTKRVRRSSAKHSQQPNNSSSMLQGAERLRKNTTTPKNGAFDLTSSSDTISSSAPNDNNSDGASAVSATISMATPPSSSSEEEPSVDFEFDNTVPESGVQSLSSVPKEKKKIKQATDSKSDSKVSVCCICDCEGTDLLTCKGHCMNSFHLDCLGIMEEPGFKFLCDECVISSGTCFICRKGHGEVKKCSKPKCPKLYHAECMQGNSLFQCGKSSSFTCPLHMCAKCTSIGVSTINHSNLLQCVECPLALHKPDCLVAGCEVIDQGRMLCYQHVKISRNANLYSHINLNTCLECGGLGSLFCCDVCSAAYHSECLDEAARPASDTNQWKCPNCAVHDLPAYGSLVITKFGVWRWWPSEVVLPEDIPDNILSKKPGDCMFVVRFCGSRDFCWTYHGRVLPYTDEAGLGYKGHKKPKASDNYKKACEEAKEINSNRRKVLEEKEAARQNCKVYTKIKTNRYLVPRPHLDHESLDFLACQCTPESPCREDSTCVNRAIHIECNPKNCPVGDLCLNQRMQKCQNAKTELVFTGDRGWGLKAGTDLSVGDFVIEYVGEVLDEAMCQERLKKAHAQSTNNFYMLTLDAGLVIDAGSKSNHARFINHSCGPNCETQKWRVRGEPRIGIFARKNIPAGAELTFDYHLDSLGNEKKKCFCGSKNCSGFLGLRSLKVVADEAGKLKAKKKKKAAKVRPLVVKKEEAEDEEDCHDDECFVCKDGGELLLCDRKTCRRAYHLQCINRKVFPPKSQKWECPSHFCTKCQKPAVSFCSSCPVSFCSKHLKSSLSSLRSEEDVLLCQSCLDHKEGMRGDVTKPPSSAATSHAEPGEAESLEHDLTKSESPTVPPTEDVASQEKVPASKSNKRRTKKDVCSPVGSVEAEVLSPRAEEKSLSGSSPRLLGLLEKSPRPLAADGVQLLDPGSSSAVQQQKSCMSPQAAAAHLKYPPAESPMYHHSSRDPAALVPQMPANLHLLHNMAEPHGIPEARAQEPHRAPSSAFRTLNRAPLFQPQSPTFGQSYAVPESHSAKLPEGYVDYASAAAAAGFQQSQQPPPVYNSFIPPVWLMPRNGFVNSIDPGTGGFGYPAYPSALINPANPLGFPYFGEPIPNFGMHQQQPLSSASVVPPSSSSSPSFPAVLPPTHPQNGLLAWKYC